MEIKVVSFNLRHANDKDGNSVVERAPRLHKIITRYSPDIIGFQELRTSWEPFLEKYFSAEYDSFCKYRSEGTDHEAAPIYWRKDKFTCIKTGYFWLSDNSDFYINNALKVSALSVMLGDTDNDGELGEGDISAMRNHLLDISSVAKADSANINCDKDIDICDLVALSNHLLNYPAAKELKILALGNSYSVDGMSYLWNILTDAGVENVTLGNLAIGGCSIDSHWTHISNKDNDYNYFKNTSGKWKLTEDVSIETALLEEDWDIITVQQASIYSGQPDTYENLSNVLNYIENNKTNKDAKIFWHMTWAYQQDHESTNFENYNSDQMTMYNAIVNAVNSKVITNELIDGLIPSGTTIQNMRTSYLGDTLTRDGTHLSENYGRYAAGLTWMKAITGISPSEVDWVPTSYSYLSEHKNMIDEAVNSAIETPFAVTNSTYTEAP